MIKDIGMTKLKDVSEVADTKYHSDSVHEIITQDRLDTYKAIEGILEGMERPINDNDIGELQDYKIGRSEALMDLKQQLKTLFNINEKIIMKRCQVCMGNYTDFSQHDCVAEGDRVLRMALECERRIINNRKIT